MAKSNLIISIIEAWGKLTIFSQITLVLVLGLLAYILNTWEKLGRFSQGTLFGIVAIIWLVIATFLTRKYEKKNSDSINEIKKRQEKNIDNL